MKRSFGFTLIEILVSSAIIVLLAGGGLAAYLDFNNRQILDTTASELKNNLRQARGWAMAGKKFSYCGDSDDRLANYKVSFYPSGHRYEVTLTCLKNLGVPVLESSLVSSFSYDEKVTISPERSPFIFLPLTGETDVSSFNITLSLGSRSRVLTVNTNGEIN